MALFRRQTDLIISLRSDLFNRVLNPGGVLGISSDEDDRMEPEVKRHARTFTLPRCKTNRFKNSFFMASGRIVNNF